MPFWNPWYDEGQMSCWKLVSFLFPSLLLSSHFRKSLVQCIVKVPPHFEDSAQKMNTENLSLMKN